MKIYIEHEKEFYDYSGWNFDDIYKYLSENNLWYHGKETDKRGFEIGARVYFEGVGWTEVVESTRHEDCVFWPRRTTLDACVNMPECVGTKRKDAKSVAFKKLEMPESKDDSTPYSFICSICEAFAMLADPSVEKFEAIIFEKSTAFDSTSTPAIACTECFK